MEVICYKKCRDWLGFLIKWWTWGPYSHTELRFSDGTCFSSSWVKERRGFLGLFGIRAGTRFKKIEMKPGRWDRWKISIDPAEEAKIRDWCKREEWLPYDVVGIFGFVLGKDLDSPFAWYCSEICARALHVFGICDFPRKISPNGMARIMREHPDVFQPVTESE